MRLVGARQPAVLWLSAVSEIEGLAYLALGVLMQRVDVFLQIQPALLPSAIAVATAAVLPVIWRRAPATATAEASVDRLSAGELAARIGATAERAEKTTEPSRASAPASPAPEPARWRRALERR